MSSYLYMLIITSVCGGVCSILAWGGFEKYMKYIASLICVCLMIAPLKNIDITDAEKLFSIKMQFDDYDSGVTAYPLAEEMTEKSAEDYITRILFSEFGIKAVSADIKIDWVSEKDAIIEDIAVTLTHEDMQYAKDAEEYLLKTLGGEVKIFEE